MRDWPDTTDLSVTVALIGLVVVVVLAGIVFLFFDLHAWAKAFNKALTIVRDFLPHIPAWARRQTPGFLLTFGLRLPCTEEELLRAYRKKVKDIHPDKGGDRKRFMKFQNDFERALEFLRNLQPEKPVGDESS